MIYELPERDAYNLNFESCGVESLDFVSNIGSLIWIVYGNLFIAIISLAFINVEKIWKRIGQSYYWNGLIRLVMSAYQDFALLSTLNVAKVEWINTASTNYSYILSSINLVLLTVLPIIFTVIVYKKRAVWDRQDIQN